MLQMICHSQDSSVLVMRYAFHVKCKLFVELAQSKKIPSLNAVLNGSNLLINNGSL